MQASSSAAFSLGKFGLLGLVEDTGCLLSSLQGILSPVMTICTQIYYTDASQEARELNLWVTCLLCKHGGQGLDSLYPSELVTVV